MNDLRVKNLIQFTQKGILKAADTVKDALNVMSSDNISSVIIADKELKPIGIFTEYDALKMISESVSNTSLLSQAMTSNLFTIIDSTYVHDAYILLTDKGYRHLIVVDENGIYQGIVSEGDFLRHMGLDHLSKVQLVEHAMDKTPLLVETTSTIRNVAMLMKEQHCDYAIITDNFKAVGIIHERAIAHYFVHYPDQLDGIIDSLISKELYFVHKTVTLQESAALLTQHGIHQLIVIDENEKIIGLLQRFELLKAIHGSYFDILINTIEQKSEKLEALVKQQEVLIEKTNILDTVINTIPDLVWVKDAEGKYITCNRMFERLYNTPREQMIGKDDFHFVPKEMAEFFREHDKIAIEAGKSMQNEEYLVFGDGSYEGMFETIKTPIKDSNNQTFGVLGIARNISERKVKEDELKRAYADLSAAEELAHVGSWRWDIQKGIFSGSAEACRIYGVEEFERGGFDRLLEIEHPDDREMVKSQLLEAMQTGHYESVHRLLVNGETKWVSVSAKFFKDESGRYIEAQGMLQDITIQKLYELELERLANYDPLTGLANRTLLLSHLQKLIHRNQRSKKNSALLLLDIDHFRDINDSFGHQMGDEMLVQIAQRIQEKIRKEDFSAHLSADEFVVVLENLHSKEDAAHVAKEMITMLSEPYIVSNNIEIRIGVSIGIVMITEHSKLANELVQFADAALFKAKVEGRNCYRYYSDELTYSAQERLRYQSELFHALENNEFEMYYQPQTHIETNHIIGAEALIRWNHPEQGLIMPSVFIPIAEESGLIARIGEWTLYEACRQGKIWHDKGFDLHISVNVSLQQLRHQNLISVIDNVLGETLFRADKLVLELTESAMMKHEDELALMLHTFRSKGISIAIDDFGTGYSSYSYLKKFPIDILKIDKSFIDDVPYKKDDTAIVKAIIAMAEILDYQILAEGVEHQAQAEFLHKHGCGYFQGYLKSRPIPSAEFEKLLA